MPTREFFRQVQLRRCLRVALLGALLANGGAAALAQAMPEPGDQGVLGPTRIILAAQAAASAANEPAHLVLDVELRSLWYMTFFTTGSSRLGPIGRKSVRMMAPEARKAIEIVVTGHTDATGSAAGNAVLADKRARAVVKALRQQGAVKARYTVRTNTAADLFDMPLDAKTPRMPVATASMFRRADTELRQPVP